MKEEIKKMIIMKLNEKSGIETMHESYAKLAELKYRVIAEELAKEISGRLEQQVREKFMETIDEWKESIKANIEEAIDSQEQENREEYHHGIEVASKYAIEMMDKHLELNKFSA